MGVSSGGQSKRERGTPPPYSRAPPEKTPTAAAAAAEALANAVRKSAIAAEEAGGDGVGVGVGGGGAFAAKKFKGFMESLMGNVERPEETEMARFALEQVAVAHLEVWRRSRGRRRGCCCHRRCCWSRFLLL